MLPAIESALEDMVDERSRGMRDTLFNDDEEGLSLQVVVA